MAATHSATFSVQEARDIVKDLLPRNPVVYWTDFLLCVAVGYTAGAVYLEAPFLSLPHVISFFVAGFALFRLGSFIHEIVHMTGKTLRGFRVAWNLIAGVMMLMPSHMYDNHIDHHSTKHYGTGRDGEYLPLAGGPLRYILYFLAQDLFLPLFVLVRFLIIAPISFLHPRLRKFVLERMSSFVLNLKYRKEVAADAPLRLWAGLEVLCFIRIIVVVPLIWIGMYQWTDVLLLYPLALFVLGLNYNRNLVAHHYRSEGEPMSHVNQLIDSVNIRGGLFTELFFPLGLRYHALHHLFPSMPYHNLGRAHRRLLEQLPAGSAYHQSVRPSYWSVLKELVRDSLGSRDRDPSSAQLWYDRREQMLAAMNDGDQPHSAAHSGQREALAQ